MMQYMICRRRNESHDRYLHFHGGFHYCPVGLGCVGGRKLEMNDFLCPIEDHSCPYCEKDGLCSLGFPAYQICEDAKEAQENA